MAVLEVQTLTRETQKIILKEVSEFPTLSVDELLLSLKNKGKNISQEEVIQVLHSISPEKNWSRASEDEMQKEVLEFLWILEFQILFLLATKQKETTVAEFNQIRLQNKQTKAPRDLIRHVQAMLHVDGKNLAKFRKFEKDFSYQNDLDPNTQAMWAIRMLLATTSISLISSVQELPKLLVEQFKERFSMLSEKVGKTIQRICEKFTEKYFPKDITEIRLKELISVYQFVYSSYKKGTDLESVSRVEFSDQNKVVQDMVKELKDIQEIVKESHEGGFLSKLISGKVKNREGVISKVDQVLDLLHKITEINTQTGKSTSDKVLLVKKLQSDYENILLVKSQLENDLYNLKDKMSELQEKNTNMEKELHDSRESLERAHEKIAYLQQKVDGIPEFEAKANMLREELNIAKDIALRLYRRTLKIKSDLVTIGNEKPKVHKINTEPKVNHPSNSTVHTVKHDSQTGETTITTEEQSDTKCHPEER